MIEKISTRCIDRHPTIDTILNSYKGSLAGSFDAYRNHVYRVYNLAALNVNDETQLKNLAIAAAFHDLGIWTHHTFDYLNPSIGLARVYFSEQGIGEEDAAEIVCIIDLHHKLTRINSSPLAEIFRVADLIDLSLGLIRHGTDGKFIQFIKKKFPNRGFHVRLVKLFFRNLIRHPLRPLPMYKW